MQSGPMHEAVKPLTWLIGKWSSVTAKGQYPSISPFEYNEEIEFISIGQPMLNYTLNSWHSVKKEPLHLESGFLRIKPGTNEVAFMVAHNFGLTTLEEGKVEGTELTLSSTQLSRMTFAKDPAVIATQRVYKLAGDTLECTMSMQTQEIPLTEHLRVIYKKKE